MKNLIGRYMSIHDFIDKNNLNEKASQVLGEDWEAENDVEQIQEIVGDEYVVHILEPKTKREERRDDYIVVTKK